MRRLVLSFAVIVLCSASAGATTRPSFAEAQARERSLLEVEHQALRSAIDQLEEEGKRSLAEIRSDVSRLSAELTKLRLENDQQEEALTRNWQAQPELDSADPLANFFSQTGTALSRMQLNPPPNVRTEPGIGQLFQSVATRLHELGSVRIERGTYFDKGGAQREGDILWVSRVSATGLDPRFGGMLAPVDAGGLKVVQPADERLQQTIGTDGAQLSSVLLFDPTDQETSHVRADDGIWGVFLSGGFVMWPILLLAVVSLLILLERFFVLRRIHTNADHLMKKVGQHIAEQAWDRAKQVCKDSAGAVAQVLMVILRSRKQPRQQQEELVYEVILAQKPRMERFLPVLNIVAAVAPLLGLLGTVTGMIGTFEVITVHGTGDPQMLSGGISEALLTTQFGLIVAIPALFFHAILSSRVDHVLGDMETNALRLLNQLHCPRPAAPETQTASQAAVAV